METMTIGPDDGTLTLHTGVEGRAAKMGHALTIQMHDWSATATFDGPDPTELSLRTALDSLEIVSGEGGVKALTEKDKVTIKDSALDSLSASKHPEVTFQSRSITASGDGYAVDGELSVAGKTSACMVDLTVQRTGGTATVEAVVPIVQTDYGIKPYSGLMGGLKVKDRVEVQISAKVSEPA